MRIFVVVDMVVFYHRVQPRMISVVSIFVFLRL